MEKGAVTDRTCLKWFTKLHARIFSPDNAPCFRRSVEVDSYQSETLIENDQRYTTQERDSQHIQNIQINKVTGENEKCVSFIFTEKAIETFWPTQYVLIICNSLLNRGMSNILRFQTNSTYFKKRGGVKVEVWENRS